MKMFKNLWWLNAPISIVCFCIGIAIGTRANDAKLPVMALFFAGVGFASGLLWLVRDIVMDELKEELREERRQNSMYRHAWEQLSQKVTRHQGNMLK